MSFARPLFQSSNVTGPTGPTGPAGPAIAPAGGAGTIGATGPAGAVGADGTIGATGPAGTIGATGPAGVIGATGPAGVIGATGPVGADGAVGATGPAGAIGATGPAGAIGPIGIMGPAGSIGATGSIGPTGSVGAADWIQVGNQLYPTTITTLVGIGKLPSVELDVSGNVTISKNVSATAYNTTSDYRIKENAAMLDETFSVDNLRPVTYTNLNSRKQDIGLIAHELQEVYPFLVTGEKDGAELQTVNYTGLIGVLIKEIQDLKHDVAQLKQQISAANK